MKWLLRISIVLVTLCMFSVASTARVQSTTNLSPPKQVVATPFPTGPADDNTTSLGSFRIVVDPAFRPLMAGYLGYDGVSTLQSPHLFDPNTVIGRSAPHLHGDTADTNGTAVGTAGTLIADSTFSLVPPGFQGPANTREVHTEVRSLNLTPFTQPTGEFCFGPPGLAVRAGTHAPGRPISPGEVEAQSSASDFPAESFFDVFVEIDLPAFAGFPGGTLFNRDPLLVKNANLDAFPPHVVYIHENSNAVAVHFKSDDPGGKWLAGDRFGWLVLAGHGVKFDCTPGSVQEFQRILQQVPPMKVVTPTIEIDRFPGTQALVGIQMSPSGPVVNIILNGPAIVEVDLESLKDEKANGAPGANGKEEVDTELVRMELTGAGMTLRAGRDFGLPASRGQIEEQANKQTGRLDLPGPDKPFCTDPVPADCVGTQANSFFDVFFEVEVAGQILHNNTPLRIESVIDFKPPKATYKHILTNPIPLFNEKNEPTGISLVTAAHNTYPELDHFKCYNIVQSTPLLDLPPVGLKDQFGAAEAKVRKPFVFCNPVQKAHPGQVTTPIKDPDAHLKFYQIETTTDTRPRVVAVSNQFGAKQVLKIIRPLYLAVPTQKLEPGPHPAPRGLDHFKCYEVSGKPVAVPVGLKDQFLTESSVVRDPFLLCNPVQKQHAGAITPIRNPQDHLVCYRIDGGPFTRDVRTRNQFGEEGLVVDQANLLCAPSKKTKEVDEFPKTQALVGLRMGSGPVVNVILGGPATVEVDLTSLADASDAAVNPAAPDVPNNLEEVKTELISMTLTGNSTLGVIKLRAGSALLSSASPGQIEEKANIKSGRLDLPGLDEPFCTEPVPADCMGTQANSFFDVFFEVEVAGQVLHNKDPLRVEAMIDRKPPKARYKHVITTPIQLFDANGQPTQIFLVTAEHNTQPGLDHFKCYNVQDQPVNAAVLLKDQFSAARALVREPFVFCNPVLEKRHNNQVTTGENPDAHLKFYRIETPTDPRPRAVVVSNQFGEKQVLKVFEPRFLAVPTQKLPHPAPQNLDHFKCYRVTGRPADTTVSLRDQFHTESQVPVLDPFLLCNPVQKVHNNQVTPIRNPQDHLVCYQIDGAPPAPIITVQTDNQFRKETLVVNNPRLLCAPSKKIKEVDEFATTRALVGLQLPNGLLVNLILKGPSTVEVDLTSLADASDEAASPGAPDVANGLEEVKTELVSMELSTNSLLGVIKLRAGSAQGLSASLGQIEEKANIQNGRLDLPGLDEPFCTDPIPANCMGTLANSFFDVFFAIDVPGFGTLHNEKPLRIASMIKQKPPRTRYIHVITTPIELFDANNQPTGIRLVTAEHQTVPIRPRITTRVRGQIVLGTGQGATETIVLRGPATTHVFLDEACAAQDTDGDGLDQVPTELMTELRGSSPRLGQVTLQVRNVITPGGGIEEITNTISGTLELPPCVPQGRATSFFDIFFEIELPATASTERASQDAQQGQVCHTTTLVHLEAIIRQEDPLEGVVYRASIPTPLQLLDKNENSCGLTLNGAEISGVNLFLPLIHKNNQ